MNITEWASLLAVGGVLAIGGFWVVNTVGDAIDLTIRERRFHKDLLKAIKHSQPSWQGVCAIAAIHGIPKKNAIRIVRVLRNEVVVGRDNGSALKLHSKLLDEYIADYEAEEPFEGLPSNTRSSLERLRKDLGSSTDALHSVTDHFRELLEFHNTKNRRQRFYTFGGFLVGVAGFVYGVFISVYPFSQPVEPSTALNELRPYAAPQAPSLQPPSHRNE
ncbi:hypothetical protein [Pseudomonas sp. 31-12]|uniref:hypothetical protein n=1 Tax=Pseudomonas sp. 31-12 TaxID=2201356 RepID=UPI0013A5B72E|nr:hypothetical protein [Pseudomonas sp. 31-12]